MSYKEFNYPIKIREGHLDTFGHVNNAVYLELYEEARWEILNQGGFGLEHIRRTQTGPVILEVNLKFRKELKAGELINIWSRNKSYEGKIAVFEQKMINEAGEVCSTAIFTFGLFDTKNRRLIDPTADWLKAIGG